METLIAESNDSSNNYMTIELSGVEIGFQFSILFTIFIKPSVVKFFQGLHRETSNRFYFIFKWKFNLILPCFLSCNWHIPHWKAQSSVMLQCSQDCASITTTEFQNTTITPKRNPVPIRSTLHPSPAPSACQAQIYLLSLQSCQFWIRNVSRVP